MAEKGFFFNALPNAEFPTGYDRNYSADDISDWLQAAFTNGVIKTDSDAQGKPQGLKVNVGSGLRVTVNAGFACINGKPYKNDSTINIALAAAPTSGTRYDMIVLRLNNQQTPSGRLTKVFKKSVTSVPKLSDLSRTADFYDLLLGYAIVPANASSCTVVDTRGDEDLCPWFTAVKGYEDYYDAIVQQFNYNTTLSSATTTLVTTLAASLYNDRFSIVEVYTNGLKEPNTAYTVSTSGGYIVINFTAQKASGAKISVILDNFIDGEGLATAINSYNEWVNAVETLQSCNEYTYLCNGIDDNVRITNLARAWLQGGTDYGSRTIKVVGTFGWSAMAYGDGSASNVYRFFNFAGDFNRKLIVDFTDCSEISINAPAGKYTVVFAAQGVTIIGANIVAGNVAENTIVKVFSSSSGAIRCESCRFWINGYKQSQIAPCGTFENCRGSVSNVEGNSYCFQPADASLVRVFGGEYYAYTANQNNVSAIIGQSNSNAVSILYAVNAPTQARSGYYQKNSIYQIGNAGWVNCTDLVSELPLTVVSGKSNIRGTIALSKAGQM